MGSKLLKYITRGNMEKNYAKKLDIINFSSQSLNDEFNLFKDSVTNCNDNFEIIQILIPYNFQKLNN